MEIVDAQVHIPRLVVDWRPGEPRVTEADAPIRTAPGVPPVRPADRDVIIAASLTAMDAAGVDALVIDEWLGQDDSGRSIPGTFVGEGGGYRWDFSFSRYAVELYPERFSFLARAHPLDPALGEVIADLAATPGMRCLRLDPLPWLPDIDLFREGKYAPVIEEARRNEIPVMVWSNGPLLQNIEPYLRRFPDVQFVLDHMGTSSPKVGATGEDRFGEFETVFQLGREFENLALKWSTTESQSAEIYPYRDVIPYLVRALEIFGPERIMWASDQSEHKLQHSWAESFSWLRDTDEVSPDEKESLLGRTARTILDWPALGPEMQNGLYFDCANGHPSIRIAGADERSFVAAMEGHLSRWHMHQISPEQMIARARRVRA
jgi:L-fuconolactonase